MRLRHLVQGCAASAALVFAMPLLAETPIEPGTAPAGPDMRPEWRGHRAPAPYMIDPRARSAWLAECRRRLSIRDDGIGGAVIGGALGGLAGNRIAGRRHRTAGTIAGAAVGAAAGYAIDKAEDRGRDRDECEAYLDDYLAYQAYYAPAHYGYPGYGYAACCQPVRPSPKPECTETVEYIDEYVPARPRARRVIPDKRLKVTPDKRVRIK